MAINLVLLCDNYPIGLGEFFLDDEMKIASNLFEKIIIIVPEHQFKPHLHFTSNNMVIHEWKFKLNSSSIIYSLLFLLSLSTWKEAWKMHDHKQFLVILKTIVADVIKSSYLIQEIKTSLRTNQISEKNTAFYSYWHDYRALALARMAKTFNGAFIARSHSADTFRSRSTLNYLPFKEFIVTNLDKTFCISNIGKLELQSYSPMDIGKITISRLGKSNHRTPRFEKNDERIIVCSCSHFNKIKRVHLIPKILKRLNNQKIHWVHFGWGYPEYEKLVHDELMDAEFTFELKGITDNEKILDYYHENYVDFFINTSLHEGIPVSIMEAFSAGIPAIATNVGATNEIIDDSCGFLIDENFDINDAAQVISGFLNNNDLNRLKYRKYAYKKWGNEFEVNKNYSNFYSEIKSILSNKAIN